MVKRKHADRSSGGAVDSKSTPKDEVLPAVRTSDEPAPKKQKWTNKQRVLIFSSRGVSYRARHLMTDLRTLMPHSKAETKMDRKDSLFVVNEIAEMKNCNRCIYFEMKKKQDLYMWVSGVPKGPSVKFLIENVHTMLELKMTGNCLKSSRPLLSFDT
ncbi:ribosome biogenesis protein BRX1 homolog, partial [Lingula anatina]|uniref:Ribosome biogenesis protein BRX1 homolog n=1 Tax=Lingula anatina TaxID=7574 RepID=A0A1S3IWX7_LINAN